MKTFTVVFLYLVIFTGVANIHAQSRGGAFAAAAAPGQVPVPPAVTPPPTTPQAARPAGQAQPTQQQQEQLRIVADPATNSLIIYGTAQEFQNIKNILKELDAAPRQVLIEALILQVDLKATEDFGVDYEILRKSGQSIFGQRYGSAAALTTLGKLFPTAPSFGGVGGLSAVAGDNTLSAMIRAAATDSRIKIVSAPSVIASDNRPARIQVGSEEPIATGTLTAATGASSPSTSTTIQYRNTGRILTIIPQVNSQGLVNLQLKAEVSARGDDVKVGQDSFPAFNTQDAETTAVVQDGETLVIGGLIGERKSKGRSGIPYLMDLPVVGRFFGTTNDASDRTELIMLITPRVIRDRDEGRFATAEFRSKLSTVRAELERLEQDRAKSQPKPRPQALPPMPDPNQYYKEEPPQPAPSSDLPSGGTPPAPSASSSPLPFDKVPARSAFGGLNQAIDSRNAAPLEGRADDGAGNFQISERNPGVVKPTPQNFALALVPARGEAATASVKKLDGRASAAKSKRVWAVQVAALAEQKDADSLAGKLRQEGYQAYVQTNQTDAKTWHRVRVGLFEKRQDADEMKKTLAANEAYRNAYVAPN